MKVAILGAGSFGTALAQTFASQCKEVVLWTRDIHVAQHINAHHKHPLRFKELELPHNISSSTSLPETLLEAKIVVSALPMKALRSVFTNCAKLIEHNAIVVSTTKGIEAGTLLFPSEVLAQTLPQIEENQRASLSGPNFASEIVKGLPWAAVVASKSPETAQKLQQFLRSPNLRVSSSSDVAGVEIGGALKNVFAIAAGIVDGLELGCNARAALTTRSLSEMSRFADALGAEQKTLYGLAGLGDLLLSCTSAQSRNWRVGQALAHGEKLDAIQAAMGEVVEGVGTTTAASALAKKFEVKAPICEAMHAILFEHAPARNVVTALMSVQAGDE